MGHDLDQISRPRVDNSMAESFFATLECELTNQRRFRNRTDARHEIISCIGVHNHR